MRIYQHTGFAVHDRYDILYGGHKSDACVVSGRRRQFLDWYGFRFSTTLCNVHPAYPMGTRGSFSGGKADGVWRWPFTSTQCRVQRSSGAIPPLLQYAFMVWCSIKAQGQLYLTLTFTFTLQFTDLYRCISPISTDSDCCIFAGEKFIYTDMGTSFYVGIKDTYLNTLTININSF
jgi:hypothetical protein